MITDKPKKPLALQMFVLMACAINGMILVSVIKNPPRGDRRPDTAGYYAAGLLLRQGRGADLYSYDVQQRAQEGMFGVPVGTAPLPYFSLPYLALFWLPLTFLSPALAQAIWAAATFALATYLGWRAGISPILFLISTPVFLTLILGQTSLLTLAIFIGAWLLRHKPVRSGALSSLALF